MNKILISSALLLALFSAGVASAQTYTYGSGACINLTSDLSYGSRGVQVTQLQSFLVAQNYPGGGSWMITGYYGSATQAAVRIFQQNKGLPTTGAVDSATRAAINAASCGYVASPSFVVNPFSYSYNNYSNVYPNYSNTYPYNYSTTYPYTYPTYPYATTPSITSMSQNTGVPGNSVTLYGVGFDPANNTVYFGTQAISGISSENGTSLTFTIPSYYGYAANQSVQLYVSNSRGTSNTMTFTLYPYGSSYFPYNYNYQNQYQCSFPYSYGQCGCGAFGVNCPNTGVPTIIYLNPTSGAVGTSVTVFGSGFSATGNSVHFGAGVIANLNSADGRSVSFIVPSQLTGYGSQPVVVGTYNVSVTNSSGITSNAMSFLVTAVASGVAPSIQSVNGPTTLAAGAQGTWTIVVNNPGSSYLTVSVNWGDSNVYGYAASAPQTVYTQGQTTLSFTHIYYAAGTYAPIFTASNNAGQQNSASASVVVSSSSTNQITLSYLSPTSGHVGTQVILSGTGFSTFDNTVRFGVGGTQHVPSMNGTTIYYTIPAYISPCDVQTSGYCALYTQQVTPASYPIYVTSQNGTTNTLSFQVI